MENREANKLAQTDTVPVADLSDSNDIFDDVSCETASLYTSAMEALSQCGSASLSSSESASLCTSVIEASGLTSLSNRVSCESNYDASVGKHPNIDDSVLFNNSVHKAATNNITDSYEGTVGSYPTDCVMTRDKCIRLGRDSSESSNDINRDSNVDSNEGIYSDCKDEVSSVTCHGDNVDTEFDKNTKEASKEFVNENNLINGSLSSTSKTKEVSKKVVKANTFITDSLSSESSDDDEQFKWVKCVKCNRYFFDFYTAPCCYCRQNICDACFDNCTYLHVVDNNISVISVMEGGQLHPYAKLFLMCSEECEQKLLRQLNP